MSQYIMMAICTTQHLSNIWSLIHETVEQHCEAELKKQALLIKKSMYFNLLFIYTLESKDNYNTHITTIIPVVSFLKTLFSPISFE